MEIFRRWCLIPSGLKVGFQRAQNFKSLVGKSMDTGGTQAGLLDISSIRPKGGVLWSHFLLQICLRLFFFLYLLSFSSSPRSPSQIIKPFKLPNLFLFLLHTFSTSSLSRSKPTTASNLYLSGIAKLLGGNDTRWQPLGDGFGVGGCASVSRSHSAVLWCLSPFSSSFGKLLNKIAPSFDLIFLGRFSCTPFFTFLRLPFSFLDVLSVCGILDFFVRVDSGSRDVARWRRRYCLWCQGGLP